MFITPRRLSLIAGLATCLAIGCSTQKSETAATKPASQTPAAAAQAPATPPPAAQAPAAQPPAAQSPSAQAPAAPPVAAQGAANNVGRPREQGTWNGTEPEAAGKPGAYMVLDGKVAPVPDVKLGDKTTVARIVDEGKNRNRVMDHLTHLTTKIGPRLTGSSNAEAANKWAKQQFESWGLTNAELFQWGTIPVRFDRGPSYAKLGSSRENGTFRSSRDMEFTTLAWGAGTNGPVRGQVIKMPETEEQFTAVKDKLKGSWILIKSTQAGGRRGVGGFAGGMSARQRFFTDMRKKAAGGEVKDEAKDAAVPQPANSIYGFWEGTATGGPFPADGTPFALEVTLGAANAITGNVTINERRPRPFTGAKWDEATKTLTFNLESPAGAFPYSFKLDGDAITGESKLPAEIGGMISVKGKRATAPKTEPTESTGPTIEERVFAAAPAGYISSSTDDRVRTSGSYRNLTMETLPQDCEIQVRQNDYDYMNSRLADGGTIEAEINCDNKFINGPIPVYNTIAEIKGTQWPDEVVIVSAHLDSWNGPGSMGTTDNGTGSSVTIEAARILASVGAKPNRTIRFILWTGEEQGLLGSQGYVKMLKEKDQLKNISAVFVDDGGTNWEGGLHCIDSQVEFLGAATAPVNGVFFSKVDNRFMDVNIQPGRRMGGGIAGGSSDHASFLREKVPGYFWDEVGRADYGYGWHTQNDKIDLAIPEYLIQSSTCAAVTAYNLACAPTLLPRELPPAPEKKEEPKKDPGT